MKYKRKEEIKISIEHTQQNVSSQGGIGDSGSNILIINDDTSISQRLWHYMRNLFGSQPMAAAALAEQHKPTVHRRRTLQRANAVSLDEESEAKEPVLSGHRSAGDDDDTISQSCLSDVDTVVLREGLASYMPESMDQQFVLR